MTAYPSQRHCNQSDLTFYDIIQMLSAPLLDVRLISRAEQGHLDFGLDTAGFVDGGQLLPKSAVFGVCLEEFIRFVDDEAFHVFQVDAGFGLPLKQADEARRSRDQNVEARPRVRFVGSEFLSSFVLTGIHHEYLHLQAFGEAMEDPISEMLTICK